MKKNIENITPGIYRLKKPIWKFDSLILDEGTILNDSEIEKLKKWGITRVDVKKINKEETEDIKGSILDIVLPSENYRMVKRTVEKKEETQEIITNTDLSDIHTIEELEKHEFDITIEDCEHCDDIYTGAHIQIPDIYSQNDINQSAFELIRFLKNVFKNVNTPENIDFSNLKLLISLKIDELRKFGHKSLNNIQEIDDYNYIFKHSVSVMLRSISIGEELGYSENWLAEIAIAALFHDIGMAKIEKKYYINKKKYSFDDYFEIFKHPVLGVDFLTSKLSSYFGNMVNLAVYQHHERLDGSGYPRGRKNNAISEYARIIGICDVYDAMTSERPYRKKFSVEESFKFIVNNADILFDREIVDILFRLLIREGILEENFSQFENVIENPVIIADTSPYNLWYICHLLRSNNIPVMAVNQYTKLIDLCKSVKPRVIMIDASISREKGLDLIKSLHLDQATADVPLIYSSNSGNKSDVVEAINIGVKGYLKKPYTFDFVVNRLSKFLDDKSYNGKNA